MKSINNQAPVKNSNSITIQAKPEKIWSILTNINQWPQWQGSVSKAQLNGSLQPGTTFDWKNGGSSIHSTLHTTNPNQEIGWTGKVFGIYAIHNWQIKPGENGTEVYVEESMEGLLAGLFKGYFNKMLKSGMDQSLEELKAACEL